MKKILIAIAAIAVFGALFAACTVKENAPATTPEKTPDVSETTPTPAATATTPASTPTPTPTPTPVIPETADPYEVLKDKRAFFFGDSIVAASTYDDTPFYGWPGRIKDT